MAPLRTAKGWTQIELSRKTGYDQEKNKGKGYSPRMISHFENYNGKGKGKPMSPEAMYLFSRLFGLPCMEALYEWFTSGEAE